MVIADTRDQVGALNAAIRDLRTPVEAGAITSEAGERIGVGDRVATRRNDRDLDVANRDTWTVTSTAADGSLAVQGRGGDRTLPPAYTRAHVELSYATTVHGAQGETVDRAHLLLGETTGAAAAYVGMTRGRNANTAHLVAENPDEARAQWIATFSRDRADLGPAHAAQSVADDIDRYGPQPRRRTGWPTEIDPEPTHGQVRRRPTPSPSRHAHRARRGIGR